MNTNFNDAAGHNVPCRPTAAVVNRRRRHAADADAVLRAWQGARALPSNSNH